MLILRELFKTAVTESVDDPGTTAIFVLHFDGFRQSLYDKWKTQLGAGHLTQSAARFICDGRLRIYTDGFFELGASAG